MKKTDSQGRYHGVKYKRIFIFIFILISVVLATYYIVKNLYYSKNQNSSDSEQIENKNE